MFCYHLIFLIVSFKYQLFSFLKKMKALYTSIKGYTKAHTRKEKKNPHTIKRNQSIQENHTKLHKKTSYFDSFLSLTLSLHIQISHNTISTEHHRRPIHLLQPRKLEKIHRNPRKNFSHSLSSLTFHFSFYTKNTQQPLTILSIHHTPYLFCLL